MVDFALRRWGLMARRRIMGVWEFALRRRVVYGHGHGHGDVGFCAAAPVACGIFLVFGRMGSINRWHCGGVRLLEPLVCFFCYYNTMATPTMGDSGADRK